jgi:uncharacterized CHY-type Zn-finger protein
MPTKKFETCYECNGEMIVHPNAEDWMVDDNSNKILWCKKCGLFASESDLKMMHEKK